MTPENCPSLEQLAALVDGRLIAAEVPGVAEHVAGCPRCLEIVAETARLQDDAPELFETESGPVPLAPLPAEVHTQPAVPRSPFAQRAATWGLAAAALLLVAVGARTLGWIGGPPTFPSQQVLATADLSAGLARLGEGWNQHQWPVYRGNAPARSAPADVAFRIGVLLVDLEVAVQAGLDPGAELFLLQASLKQVAFTDSLELAYADIDLNDATERAELERATANIVGSRFFDFGRWAQASAISLRVGAPDAMRAVAAGLAAFADLDLRAEVREALEAVRDAHATGDAAVLAASLNELIRLAGQS